MKVSTSPTLLRNEHKAVIHAACVLGERWKYISHEYRLYAQQKALSTTIMNNRPIAVKVLTFEADETMSLSLVW